MHYNSFVIRCLRETLSGLQEGLSLFSGASRSAIIFTLQRNNELLICDPQNLLRGHELKLQNIYIDSIDWCKPVDTTFFKNTFNYIEPQANLQLDGLISNGGSSGPVYYQMWFTEHHPDICSVRPTECWLEHAVLRFSHDMANDSNLYTGISGSFLREYATHAVHDCIVDRAGLSLGLDTQIHIYPVLEAILGISKTNEEGVQPYGALTFIEPRFLQDLKFLAKFKISEQPVLGNFKHVRKLLQAVEHSERTLISDGKNIVGIADRNIAQFHVTADFNGKLGFLLVENETLCSFHDGSYSSSTHRAKLFEVEEALLDFDLDPSVSNDMFQIIAALVHNAEDLKFGCTFVIDLAPIATATAGQALTPPINLRQSNELALAAALSKVDGALHIRMDLHLYAFACLLDGHRVANEDRARGARYNSALRFTSQHPQTIVVVVSADRPVSIFQQGKEIKNRYGDNFSSKRDLFPVLLHDWLQSTDNT
ncbi:MAG: DNA integrity scanning protein DisA nucleotide-binding domain protein [Pseudomonadota bacterium]